MPDFVDPVSPIRNNNPSSKTPGGDSENFFKFIKWSVFIICGLAVLIAILPKADETIESDLPTTEPYQSIQPAVIHDQKEITEEDLKKWDANTFDGTTNDADVSKAFVEINKIAKKSKSEVARHLGSPTQKETINPSNTPCPCDKYTYKNGSVEVVFVNGKADWITINNLHTRDYNPNVLLESIGLPRNSAPNMNNEIAMRWYGRFGFVEISAFPDQNRGLDYVTIEALTDL